MSIPVSFDASDPVSARRFVTAHDENGKAIFRFENEIPRTATTEDPGKRALFGVPWKTEGFPVDNDHAKDMQTIGGPIYQENGSLCRFVDFPPRSSSPMHRTETLDYGIVIYGNLVLELDDGAERVLKQSDVVVQRGTIHAWHNRTDDWARMVYVLIPAVPVTVNGQKLSDVMHD